MRRGGREHERNERRDKARRTGEGSHHCDCVSLKKNHAARGGMAVTGNLTIGSYQVPGPFVTPSVQPGQVFMPMHYATVNQLTLSSFDPYSKQPSYKACAVRVRREFYGS